MNVENNIGIIVTRPKGQSQNFINRLTKGGFTAFDLPGIIIEPAQDRAQALAQLSQVDQYDYLLFTSPNAVRFAKRLKLDFRKINAFISIGSGTERALKPLLKGKKIITAPKPYTSEALVATLEEYGIEGKSILIISGEGGRRLLDSAINDLGGKGEYCDVYRREVPENPDISQILAFKNNHPDSELYLTISSQEAFNNLLPTIDSSGLREMIDGVFVGSERLKNIVKDAGFDEVIQARSALENDLWHTIKQQLSTPSLDSDPLTISADNDKELSMTKAHNPQNTPSTDNSDAMHDDIQQGTQNEQDLAESLTADDIAAPATEDHATSPSSKEESLAATPKQSSGKGLTYLALILALGGLGLGGFAYYNGSMAQDSKIAALSGSLQKDASTLDLLKNRVSDFEKELASLKAIAEKAPAADDRSLSSQVALIAQKHESLNNALSQSAKGIQGQIDALKATQETLLASSTKIDNIAKVSNQAITIANDFDKKLAEQALQQTVVLDEAKSLINTIKNITDLEMLRTTEVDYLLKVALQKVQFDKDYKTAANILTSALDRLNQINSINFTETKALVTKNIEALKALQPIDLTTVTSRLEKVTSLIQQAPLKSDSALINLKNEIFNQGAPEGETWSEKLTSSLKHLVVIEDKRTEVPELMSKEDRFFLVQNIQLELTAAKVAILQDQFTIFDHSLETVQSWIKTYFDEDNADVREAIQQLQWLLDAKLEITPPNIERTLTDFEATLRAYKGA